MPATVRAFIAVAVPCPPPLAEVLRRLERLGRDVRRSAPDSLHVTLKFLGDVPREQIGAIAAELGAIARETPAATMTLRGLGAFPTAERARVLWAGLDGADVLFRAAGQCERRIAPLGFPTEPRPFTPHVTIARIPAHVPPLVFELLDEHAATVFGPAPCEALELFQSAPTSRGPRYVSLARGALTGG